MTPRPTTTDPVAADRERDDAEFYALKRQMRAEMTAVLTSVNPGESEQQQRTKAIRLARMLRDQGLSYEEITTHMPAATGKQLEVWETYALVNPTKTAAQLAAWKARHYPGAAA